MQAVCLVRTLILVDWQKTRKLDSKRTWRGQNQHIEVIDDIAVLAVAVAAAAVLVGKSSDAKAATERPTT